MSDLDELIARWRQVRTTVASRRAARMLRDAGDELADALSRLSAQEWSEEDQKLRNAVTILLQVALDELLHVVEAVDHQYETGRAHLKYTTPWHAVTSARKVREDLLAQAAMWGVRVSPSRPPEDTLPRLSAQGGGEESIPVNPPFERVPACACDPGTGEPPTRQQQLECRLRGGPCKQDDDPQSPHNIVAPPPASPAASVRDSSVEPSPNLPAASALPQLLALLRQADEHLLYARRAAFKLWTMYQRGEVSPRAELEWLIDRRDAMDGWRKAARTTLAELPQDGSTHKAQPNPPSPAASET